MRISALSRKPSVPCDLWVGGVGVAKGGGGGMRGWVDGWVARSVGMYGPWDVVEELRVVVRGAEDDGAVGERHLEAAADVLEEAIDVRGRLHAHAWDDKGFVS